MIGVHLKLFNGSAPKANLTGIQALWWDVTEPKDGAIPVGKTNSVVTDQDGYIDLDLSAVTSLAIGEYGFLMLYKLDAEDHKDSLVFAGKIQTADITSGVDMYYHKTEWIRPTDWPLIDDPVAGTEKFQGLYAVYNIETGGNGVAFACEGNYHVDWGDGTNEDFASGVTAQHVYDFNTTLGQATTEGFKCAIITVTPQSGQHLTSIDLNKRHSNYSHECIAPWLDIAINGAYITNLKISMWVQVVRFIMLQKIQLGENIVEDFSYFLRSCMSLQSVPMLNVSNGINFSYFMYSCNSLTHGPVLDTSAGTDFSYFLSYCYALQTVPLYDTSNGLNFNSFLRACYSLPSVPLFDTAKGTSFSYFMSLCYCISEIPLFDTSNGIDFSYFLYQNFGLISIPLLNTAKGTNFSNFLAQCYSLRKGATFGPRVSLSYVNCNLGPEALNEIYENLGVGVTATITVTGNWGTGSDNPSLVPVGWTVTG